MTINNVWIKSDHALVGVDTECKDANGQIEQVSKLLTLPHMNAVIAGSGQMLFSGILWQGCHSIGGDFDTLIEKMPQILPIAYRVMLDSYKNNAISFRGNHEQNSAIICGWSQRHVRLVAYVYTQVAEETGFTAVEVTPGLFFHQPIVDHTPQHITVEAMAYVARKQVRFFRDSGSDIHAGGKFIVAKLTRDRIEISPACDLNDLVV